MRAWIAIAVVLGSASARADSWSRAMDRVQGGAFLHYELTGLTAVDEGAAPPPSELVLAGVRLHGFLGKGASVAYHVGLDLFAGSTIRGGGFAYDVAVFPVGIVVRMGKTSILGFSAGVGASGAVGTLDDAVTAPLEAVAEIGNGVRLIARARVAYVAGADSRQGGAPSIAFADELDAMLGLRLGTHYGAHGFPSGNGYFVAASYRELAHTRFAGLTIGYSIDLAMPRRFVGRGDHTAARDP
jgi:hypothetical protein